MNVQYAPDQRKIAGGISGIRGSRSIHLHHNPPVGLHNLLKPSHALQIDPFQSGLAGTISGKAQTFHGIQIDGGKGCYLKRLTDPAVDGRLRIHVQIHIIFLCHSLQLLLHLRVINYQSGICVCLRYTGTDAGHTGI